MKNRMFTDSIAIASVRVFTMLSSILSTMILSRMLPLAEYGTYSVGNLIVNTGALVSAFGLIDAVNFYYNGTESDQRDNYINTVFSLIFICGGIVALAILGGKELITQYFHNPRLGAIYAYIAFRPFLHNYMLAMQNLQVSIGKAKVVAIRNAALTVTKFVAILLTALYTKNISTIFICMLIAEIISMLFYCKVLKDNNVKINPFKFDITKIKEILIFCIPMGIYIQTNALSRDLDKFIIGFFESTEKLAIYTNCSTKLPFDVISGPLLTLLIPVLTRCVKNEDSKNGTRVFKCYIKIGYIFTLTFGAGCIVVASQAIKLLYGSKYLSGLPVFIIYIIVDMINFISYSLVLTAKGRTKDLMRVSCGALGINLVINYVFYKWFGFEGPAIATVIITVGVSLTLLLKSMKILKARINDIFDLHHIIKFMAELVCVSIGSFLLKSVLEIKNIHYIVTIAVVGGSFVLIMLVLNIKDIKKCFTVLNEINQKKM